MTKYQKGDQIRAYLKSTVSLWENIVKPISFDTKFFEISKTNKGYDKTDLSELLNNIYILFDYSVNQYWINNIYQLLNKKVESYKSMFDYDSNMNLVVNRYDDLQIKLTDDLKSGAIDWLKDNRNSKREFYLRIYHGISSIMWIFGDFKKFMADQILQNIRRSFDWSVGPITDYKSHIKSDFYFQQIFDFLNSDVVHITKFCKNNGIQNSNESTVNFCGNKITFLEKQPAKLYISNGNIQRNIFVAQELKMAVKQSQLEFLKEPYEDYLDLPEINQYRDLGMLETNETSIKIK